MATLTLRPNGNGDVIECTPYPNTGESNYQDVDEASQNGDTDYVTNPAGTTKIDLYALENHTTETLYILGVTVYIYAKVTGSVGTQNSYIKIKTGGTQYDSTVKYLSTSYALYSHTWTTNPNTSAAWTWTNIDNLQAGLQLFSSDEQQRCTQLYVVVSYGGPPQLTTQATSDILRTTATGNGTITNIGLENATKRGVCWNTSGNPTVADSKSEETGSFGTGAFSRSMTSLLPDTHYYVRAYAYNSDGYGYGSQVEFDTYPNPPTGKDILYPNGESLTGFPLQYPASGANWDKVDEAVADDATTFVYDEGTGYHLAVDTYALTAPTKTSTSRTITKLTVYNKVYFYAVGGDPSPAIMKTILGSGYGNELNIQNPYYEWFNNSTIHTVNPADSEPWEWADLTDLVAGIYVSFYTGFTFRFQLTQVYVEVEFFVYGATVLEPDLTLSASLTGEYFSSAILSPDITMTVNGYLNNYGSAILSPDLTLTCDGEIVMIFDYIYRLNL